MRNTGQTVALFLFASIVFSGCAGPSQRLPIGNPDRPYCLVMGDRIDEEEVLGNPDLYTEYKGEVYLFCCKGCKPKFEEDPEGWIEEPAEPKE